jgi:HEPN domain-containing protein
VNQADLRKMAEERIKDARALIRGKRWEFAYYVAGYSVECALKSCILARMIHTAWVFEEKPRDYRVHDFAKLVTLAGLDSELATRQATSRASGDRFDSNWVTVAAWKPTSRYASKTETEARDLFDAITHKPDGVLRWLMNYW